MKQLQELLGMSLFAKESAGQLGEQGEIVAGHARQMLALNDELVLKLANRSHHGKLRWHPE